jgi:hypothetical protein
MTYACDGKGPAGPQGTVVPANGPSKKSDRLRQLADEAFLQQTVIAAVFGVTPERGAV